MMRSLGYSPRPNGSYARRLSTQNFPRFHVYLKEVQGQYEFSLHLDQKGACYENQTAHSGDYDGEILNNEKNRILSLLKE